MNDLQNIRSTQQSYGIPAVGDLFRGRPEDIQETINSVYHMLRQRQGDLEFRQEARGRWNKLEMDKQEAVDQAARLRGKNEQLQNENKDLRNQLASQELQIEKLKDQFKQKMFEKANKGQVSGGIEITGVPANVMPGEIKYSSMDFQLMVSKN